ncbi:hypothetical protein Dsin_014846 [Dipteronia sinensis]|uniref:Protein kinase domain-containing protein n=1 Tax=Dipteronia sinensis TaxID=43782 RepID=A0AAE0DRY0_9ROSI|nr:hypothetical protein Dsin_032513 [Dipteronia sinensis]KAK3220876.1 hypothetical protein Dsin_014846 [Dipteronia sinensis]
MPSRPFPESPPLISPSPSTHHHHHRPHIPRLVPPLTAAATAAFSLLLFLTYCFRGKLTQKRTVPSDSKPPYRFSYSLLRRATNSFSPSLRLGQGGFGSVFQGTLPSSAAAAALNNNHHPEQKHVAVKVMDSGSLQGEREFYNELLFASMLESNDRVVSVLGFSSDPKRRRMLLVYELMSNGNLQDALLHKKCPELMEWKKRFLVAIDIAKGIASLHSLHPPVIHGDIKPSNILLDHEFSAKIADFGLARLKLEVDDQVGSDVESTKKADLESNGGGAVEDCGSIVETESINTTTTASAFEELSQSPESFVKATQAAAAAADATSRSPELVEKEEDVKVKDYVIEWIGTEIQKERPNSNNWIGASSSSSSNKNEKKKTKKKKRLDWWDSLDEDKEDNVKNSKKPQKRRQPREWWKEEYCEELAKKKKKKKNKNKQMGISSDEDCCWQRDEELNVERKKKKSRSSRRSSKGSLDWWLEGLSGDLSRAYRNSYDSAASGEIPKSGGITSTPSMRGTVCYVAPEYGGGGDLSEKCDVYSFGVLLLVLIAGRRPLQVTESPMSEFQRANLLSWARHLARNGKLIELVDKAIVKSLDQEQALLCITVALLCLQRSPIKRPSMQEVVGMLTGESEAPKLPAEFSPSPPLRFPFKSQKKGR